MLAVVEARVVAVVPVALSDHTVLLAVGLGVQRALLVVFFGDPVAR